MFRNIIPMYRPGIWCKKGLLSSPEQILGFRIAVAYNLLNVSANLSAEDLTVFERTTRSMKLSSGVYRTTYHSRFSDLDLVTERIFRTVFAGREKIEVHDWAASTGLPSIEWAMRIFADFPDAAVTASDYFLFLIEAQNSAGETYILEPDGTAIQYVKPPFVVPLCGRERSIFIFNRLAIAWARRAADELKKLAVQIGWNGAADLRTYTRGNWTFRQVNMIHPQARRLAADNQRFRVVEHDAFRRLSQPCNALRVMNFYNPRIWGFQKVASGVKEAFESVADGGLLILGRTVEDERPPRNDVSIFQKNGSRLRLIERLGHGFEMEDEVLSIA
ncbi:MAG: hypothetical protein ACJ74Z_24085 [Bryobacteraceae bacterium]